jgi:arabinose-5-phosphate isomerase
MGRISVRQDYSFGGTVPLDVARRVLLEEAAAIQALSESLDEKLELAVEWVLSCPGKVVTCGVGKSGHIARKAAGTFSSTGTPSFFLHAAEAVHGDLGMVTDADIVLMYTHSGETDELVRLFPSLKAIGARTMLVTGRANSSAARLADLVLDTHVQHEACPNNLAPTTSTTVMLALSDALAVAVMDRRGFRKEDFAKFHPSGSLGKRLLLRVSDVMRKGPDVALVRPETPLLDVLRAITQAGAGASCVVDETGRLLGFISDGDIRRHFLNSPQHTDVTAGDVMTTGVKTIEPDLLAVEGLEFFQNLPKKLGELPVVDTEGKVLGLLMVKDLLRSGIL